MTDADAELDAIVDQLKDVGLVEVYVNEAGKEAMRLTAQGEKVARRIAMSSQQDQDDLLAAPSGAQG